MSRECAVPNPDQQHSDGDHGMVDAGARRRTYGWGDPAITAAAARDLAGQEFFDLLTGGSVPPPPVMSTVGFTPASVKDGVAVFEITPAEFHYNPMGTVHGGVISAVCDSACGCAVHSTLPAGAHYTSLDLSVKFLRPVTAATGRLRCEGRITHLGSRIALAQARLTDADGKLYASATSSCLIFRPADG